MFTALKNKAVDLLSKRKRATYILVAFLILFGGIFLLIEPASANWFEKTVSAIFEVIAGFLGKMILLLFNALVGWIAPYNDFIRSAAVSTGWVLTRDIANMFFILVLLAIAFGTILKIEQLNYQKILPKLLIMAVLINFSKTICGVVIDFAQVIMLTFVNAFMAAAGGNFLNALGIYRMMQINQLNTLDISDSELAKAFIFATAFLSIALIVVIVYIMVLAYRIVMLWILIILAPVAWLAGAFPVGKASAAYSQWWDNFVGAVIVGPILAFFLWLALLTAGGGTLGKTFENPAYTASQSEQAAIGTLGTENFFLNEAATTESTVGFIIATALLLAGLAAAQQSGGMAGTFAGNMASKTKGFAAGAVKGAAVGAGALAVKGARRGAGYTDRQFRLRERAYGALGRVPGLKQYGMTNLAKVRSERAGKTAELAKTVKSLAPKEVDTLLGGAAITQDQKDLRMLARKQALSTGHAKFLAGQGKSPSEIKSFQASTLAALEGDAKDRGDVETMKWAGEYKEKRPQLIEDSAAKAKAYSTASPDDMKKWTMDAWKDTEGLKALAEQERTNPGSVSSVVDKIGGQPKALFNKFNQQYGPGTYPGKGSFSLEKGFEAEALDAASTFKQMAHDTQIQTFIRNRDNVVLQDPEAGKVGTGEARMYSPSSDVAMYMKKAHQLGGTEAYNLDTKTGNFNKVGTIDSVAAKNTFNNALMGAVRDIKSDTASAEIKTEAANFISNIDVGSLKVEGGDYGNVVLDQIDHESLAQAHQAAGPDQKAQVESIIRGVSDTLKTKMKELAPDSDEYAAAFAKYQKMKMNQSINRHVS